MIYFCLSGEGARGAYQAYAMKQLEKQGIIPNALYGTSSGALNAFVYSIAGPSYLQEMWSKIDSFWDVFSINYFNSSGFFNCKPLKKKLDKLIGRMFKINTNIYYANAYNGRLYSYHIQAGKICDPIDIEAVISAVSIPGVVALNKEKFCDAMISCLLPHPNIASCQNDDKIFLILGRNYEDNVEIAKPWRYLSQIWHLNNMIDQIMTNEIRRTIGSLTEACKQKNIELTLKQPMMYYRDSLDFSQCKYLATGLTFVSPTECVLRTVL